MTHPRPPGDSSRPGGRLARSRADRSGAGATQWRRDAGIHRWAWEARVLGKGTEPAKVSREGSQQERFWRAATCHGPAGFIARLVWGQTHSSTPLYSNHSETEAKQRETVSFAAVMREASHPRARAPFPRPGGRAGLAHSHLPSGRTKGRRHSTARRVLWESRGQGTGTERGRRMGRRREGREGLAEQDEGLPGVFNWLKQFSYTPACLLPFPSSRLYSRIKGVSAPSPLSNSAASVPRPPGSPRGHVTTRRGGVSP